MPILKPSHLAHGAPWDASDRENLRAFLRTTSGEHFLAKLTELQPALVFRPGGMDYVAGKRSGWEAMGEAIALMSLPTPDVSHDEMLSAAYPSLFDDGAWADGRTTKPQ